MICFGTLFVAIQFRWVRIPCRSIRFVRILCTVNFWFGTPYYMFAIPMSAILISMTFFLAHTPQTDRILLFLNYRKGRVYPCYAWKNLMKFNPIMTYYSKEPCQWWDYVGVLEVALGRSGGHPWCAWKDFHWSRTWKWIQFVACIQNTVEENSIFCTGIEALFLPSFSGFDHYCWTLH